MQEIYSPSIEEVLELGNPQLCNGVQPSNPSKEVVALATSVFQSIEPRVFDCHKMLAAQLGYDLGPNLWLIPSQERMPFPDACLFAVASMIATESLHGRKADWFLWLEDDVVVPTDTYQRLRAAADPAERPFIAAVGYDRYPKFLPAVWERTSEGRLKRWTTPPGDGVVRVAATGLVAALFHRSLFERVPQPWFGITSRLLKEVSEKMESKDDMPISMGSGFKPDMLWSRQLNEVGIPIYIHCGVVATHMGLSLPINKRTAPILREMSFMDRENLEAMTRGYARGDNSVKEEITSEQLKDCDPRGGTSAMPARVRQGVSQGMGGTHGTGDEPGEDILT